MDENFYELRNFIMRKIAVLNQKGGSGKTTSVVNLGAYLTALGKRVLLIDMDPQAHTTIHLGFDIHGTKQSIYDVLVNEMPVSEVLVSTRMRNLFLLPAKIELSSAEIELVNVVGREIILRDALSSSRLSFDYILVDCPPSLGLLTLNSLTTVNEVIIPIQAEFFALEGLSKLLQTVEIVRKRLNPRLKISGIIITMYSARKNICKDVVAKVQEHFPGKVLPVFVRENVKLAEAPSHGQTIFEYAPSSYGAEDYQALARELIRGENYAKKKRTRKRPVKLDKIND